MATTLYVGNMNPGVTEHDLREFFTHYGPVLSIRFCGQKVVGGVRLGLAEVEMATDGQAALAALNGAVIHGRGIEVNAKPLGALPRFADAITRDPDAQHFRVFNDWASDDPVDWEFEALSVDLLSDAEGLFVMRGINILPDESTLECWISMNLPERHGDSVYFLRDTSLRSGYHRDFPGDFIPAVALDCFGDYELFYSRIKPQVGIDVLKRGLAVAQRKCAIAQDLGYIYRDEGRFQESAEMFKIAVDEGPSSYFIYQELAAAYGELGDVDNQKKYMALFERGMENGP